MGCVQFTGVDDEARAHKSSILSGPYLRYYAHIILFRLFGPIRYFNRRSE
jgi:hypothetical protein